MLLKNDEDAKLNIRQRIFEIVSDGSEDMIGNTRKTDRIMKVFNEEALLIAVKAVKQILEDEQNKI
jgi:hypothetical protein